MRWQTDADRSSGPKSAVRTWRPLVKAALMATAAAFVDEDVVVDAEEASATEVEAGHHGAAAVHSLGNRRLRESAWFRPVRIEGRILAY